LHDRDAGDRAVNDQQNRRGNQDAEAAARGNRTRRDLRVIARFEHRGKREQSHQRDHGADYAGRRGENCARDDGRHCKRARHPRSREMQALEQAVDQRGALDQVTHEHEQRDRDQHVVRHDRIRALHHEVEDLPVGERGIDAAISEPAEEHAHAHQRERGREAQHDADHDQREHQEAQMAIGHLRWRGHQDEYHDHHRGHDGKTEPDFLPHFGVSFCWTTY
jgi:hypothetical protein